MGRGRGSLGTAKSRGCSRAVISRFTQALLSASILALIPSILLWSQLARVEARAAASDVPANTAIIAVTNTPTATATNTPTATVTNTPAPTVTPTATPTSPYVLDVSGAAAAAGWPQQYSNWCGIATIGLVANYLGASISQWTIMGILNDPPNQSQWSYPAPSSAYWGPCVPTDISGDFGTDPRSPKE